jgi:hypothetical protein
MRYPILKPVTDVHSSPNINYSDQIKEDEMSRACSMYGRDE